jgi:hypothetical protein
LQLNGIFETVGDPNNEFTEEDALGGLMKAMVAVGSDGRSRVRPAVLIGCALLFAVVVLPIFFSHRYYAQMCLLMAACLCVISGWFVLVIYRELDTTWRGRVALFTSVYLTASIPGFFIEFSRITWFMHAHWASLYVRPWVHWGFIYIYLT